MPLSEQKELDLLKQLSLGSEDAFTALYYQEVDRVFTVVRKYVQQRPEAEEIVQQIFIKLWERRETLADVKSLKDYLFVATRNMVFNYFNRIEREARLLSKAGAEIAAVQGEETDSQVREKEYRQLLDKAVSLLPPQQKQVYTLAEYQHLDYDEIAGQLQISRATVKKHLELARKFVRQYIRGRMHIVIPALLLMIKHCLSR